MLKINNLYAAYMEKTNRSVIVNKDFIIENINFEINSGETVLLEGKNGSGKSTLAKAIINNIPHMEGEIIFNGNIIFNNKKNINLKTHDIIRHKIGYYLQGGRIFPQLTVDENLSIAVNGDDLKKSKYFCTLEEEFSTLLGERKEQATYLSTGQKHILAFAMVLLKDPELLILDEPGAGLDEVNIKMIKSMISKLKSNRELAIILIEHRTDEMADVVDRRIEIVERKLVEK